MSKAAKSKCRYARLQGTFWRHDRTGALSLAAVGLHARAMSYCADQMTDGAFPAHLLGAFFGGAVDQAVVTELVESGVWKLTKTGYAVRDWEQHNITAEKWEQKKEDHRQRMAALRAAKAARENASDSANVPARDRSQPDHNAACDAPVIAPSLDEGRRTKDEDEEGPPVVDQRSVGDVPSPTSRDDGPKGPAGDVFRHWRNVMGKPRAKWAPGKRERLIRQALRSHGLETVIAAIDGCSGSPFHMGENDRRQRYDSLELILRDAEHIERFADMATGGTQATTGAPLPAGSYGETDELELFPDVTPEQMARAERGRRHA